MQDVKLARKFRESLHRKYLTVEDDSAHWPVTVWYDTKTWFALQQLPSSPMLPKE